MSSESTSPESALAQWEHEVIDLFVAWAQTLGLPKSLGQIYGLLYCSPEPLCLETIQERLQISKGSVSQGLKSLKSLGAVQTSTIAGDRRDFFNAEVRLKRLLAGILQNQIQPMLDQGEDRLQRIQSLAATDPSSHNETIQERLEKLQTWRDKSAKFLPWIVKFMGDV